MIFFKKKLRKLLIWKYYWNFKNLFRWTWLDIKDFKQYEIGDDTRYINWKISSKYDKLFLNVLWEQKDTDIDLFLDINKNFLGWVQIKNLDMISEFLKDIYIYSKRSWANLKVFSSDKDKLKMLKLKNEVDLYRIFDTISQKLKKALNHYESSLDVFLKSQKKIWKRRVVIIISDFLDIDEENTKIIKSLKLKNEVFLIKIKVDYNIWKNYDLFDINQKIHEVSNLNFISI